jgi:hypothetical protein
MKTTIFKTSILRLPFALLLIAAAMAGCEEKQDDDNGKPKSAECDIVLFTVNGMPWAVNSSNITYTYPAGTAATMLTPAITVSVGATISPPLGTAQNFFTVQGVTYTVTAEDGVTKKAYTAKATITADPNAPNAGCEIVLFAVDGVPWDISGTTITHTYPAGTAATMLTPAITVSEGATISPPPGTAQNFFTEQGVTYTVTTKDGTAQKTYTAKATVQTGDNDPKSTACNIVSFVVDGTAWNINGTDIMYTYPEKIGITPLTPIITLSPGATVNPPSGEAQYFLTAQGVTYTVTAEDGVTKKTYTVKATQIAASGTAGACTWTYTDYPGSILTIGGNGAMDDYTSDNHAPWSWLQQGQSLMIIETVVIEEGVTTIGDYAFYLTHVTSITIPNSVTTIGERAFSHCGHLRSVTIPNSVTAIGKEAFINCLALTSVTIGNSVTTIGQGAFYSCSALTGSLTIPNSVTTIDSYTFSGCRALTSVTIPNSVTSIGEGAFSVCRALTSVTIPNSVTTIGERAFSHCDALASITIPNSVTAIGNSAFSYCSNLVSVTIPNTVKTIGESAFSYCSNLVSVTIPNSVTTIGSYTFDDCRALTSVAIGNSVTTIGDYAFSDCSALTSVTIPNSVTTIGREAFSDCIGLTSLTIGNSVTTIGNEAFYDCSNLTSVTNLNPVPQKIGGGVITGVFSYANTSACTLRVPAGAVAAYKVASGWREFGNIIGI